MERGKERTPIKLRTRARIAAHSIWDHSIRPLASKSSEVPWHAEGITATWLNAVLKDQLPAGAKAQSVEITGGDDGSSFRRSITVGWNAAGREAGLAAHLFAKSTPTLATRLSAGMAAPAEGRFLRELRPNLAIEAPVCLYSARDPVSGRSLHLFEDLTVTRGATFCRVNTSIDLGQAEEMIDTLAVLHGSFMNSADVQAHWLNTYEAFFQAAGKSGIKEGHENAISKAAHIIPPELIARRDELWIAATRAAKAHESGPRTIIHSDVHLGNWYTTSAGHMGLSDWARVCRGSWARDIAYVLMAGLSVDNRRNWEVALIERYLKALHTDHGVDISMEDAMLRYRQQSFAALLMWTPTLCPPPMLPDMQPEEMSMEMIKRIATAIDDHNALDSF